MRVAHARGGDAAPIAALDREALVAERVGHELRETIRQLLDAKPLLPRAERESIARQRRRDDRESVCRIAAEARRIGEAGNEIQELEHGSRPAMHQQERRRIRPLSRDMQKVQVVIRSRHLELREGVEARLLRAPVEGTAPSVDQAAKIVDVRAVKPRLARRRIGKTGARETLAQVRNIAVGNAQCEWLRHRLPRVHFDICRRSSNRGGLQVKPARLRSPEAGPGTAPD